MRHAENAIQKLRLANVRNAAVNQSAGVQQFHGFHSRRALVEKSAERVGSQFPNLPGSQDKSEVAKCKKGGKLEEGLGRFRLIRAGDHEGNEEGCEDPQDRAKSSA